MTFFLFIQKLEIDSEKRFRRVSVIQSEITVFVVVLVVLFMRHHFPNNKRLLNYSKKMMCREKITHTKRRK